MKRDDVPKHHLNLYDRAMTGKSRKACIKAHCLMCVGWVKSEVELCTAYSCPLFPVRPRFKAKVPT